MNHKPLLFRPDMVRALLNGRKTMTRRIINPQPDEDGLAYDLALSGWYGTSGREYKCKFGKPGDLIYVRETCRAHELTDKEAIDNKYNLTLKITDIRVERLQEITNEDAKNEGLECARPHRHGVEGLLFDGEPKDPYAHKHNTGINDCWICAFWDLWARINGIKSWYEDPWVWAIEFEVIKQNVKENIC